VARDLHIAHWKLSGTTLAPLELNEVMYTLEAGVITAGFLLMVSMALATLIFGRFFCSWACHILALEDLCSWLLRKLHIRPRALRSRVLALVPAAALFYMFIWPQILRWREGRPPPELRLLTDEDGWASFVTSDFWRNLPDPWIAGLTFLICGFAIVYFLGSRSFCLYGCPYGAVFSLADRFAPGRIKLTGNCEQCGICTGVCTSNVRVHEEIARYGKVVDSSCMKDLDCVGSCPQEALSFGFTRPALLQSFSKIGRRGLKPDLSLGEELLVAAIFLATLLVFRGLYVAGPFLMSLGLGAILAYIGVTVSRVIQRADVRLVQYRLKKDGRITTAGHVFLATTTVCGLLFAHSAYIRYHEFRGQQAFDVVSAAQRTTGTLPQDELERAASHLTTAVRHGLFHPKERDEQLASLYLESDRPERALPHLQRSALLEPDDVTVQTQLGELLANQGEMAEAVKHFERIVELRPDAAGGHYNLAVILATLGQSTRAVEEYRVALELNPDDADVHNNLGFLLTRNGDLDTAAVHFRRAIELQPNVAHAYFNLGRIHQQRGEAQRAAELFREAARLDPTYAEYLAGDGLR